MNPASLSPSAQPSNDSASRHNAIEGTGRDNELGFDRCPTALMDAAHGPVRRNLRELAASGRSTDRGPVKGTRTVISAIQAGSKHSFASRAIASNDHPALHPSLTVAAAVGTGPARLLRKPEAVEELACRIGDQERARHTRPRKGDRNED
jgi:hypothetical protein